MFQQIFRVFIFPKWMIITVVLLHVQKYGIFWNLKAVTFPVCIIGIVCAFFWPESFPD